MQQEHHTQNGRDDDAPALMSGERFASYMEKRLALLDEIQMLSRNGMLLQFLVRGSEVTIDLAPFHNAYMRNPAQLDTIARNFAQTVLGEAPDRSRSNLPQLLARIYPMIKPLELLVAVREQKLPMLAYREFLADLIITYVIAEQQSLTYINEEHLEHWGLALHELHEQAIANLRRSTLEQVDFVSVGEGEQRLFIFNSGDGYDATRLLLTDILASWKQAIPGNLVIGIPNRDFLIAFSDANPDILRGIAYQIQADAAQQANGLTDQLFTLVGGRIREYIWE